MRRPWELQATPLQASGICFMSLVPVRRIDFSPKQNCRNVFWFCFICLSQRYALAIQKFEGPRFEDHGLDVDVLPELTALTRSFRLPTESLASSTRTRLQFGKPLKRSGKRFQKRNGRDSQTMLPSILIITSMDIGLGPNETCLCSLQAQKEAWIVLSKKL